MTSLDSLLNDPGTAGAWNLDAGRSTVGFSVKNLWGLAKVKGRFDEVSADGRITGDGGVVGRLDIAVASLHTGIGKRDQHLRSADFFDADRYPQISVEITGIQRGASDAANLQATFHIKGVTAPVTLPAQLSRLDDASMRVVSTTDIDRGQFGVGGNQLGMIAQTVTLSADVYFVRAPR